mmetsp:Transcript_121220/g.214406  ORF Transcript_121220/g.214406 Transcript_121220/m.214406 type:complete len:92 (+) Transcript_121220:1340-1615(+)
MVGEQPPAGQQESGPEANRTQCHANETRRRPWREITSSYLRRRKIAKNPKCNKTCGDGKYPTNPPEDLPGRVMMIENTQRQQYSHITHPTY